MKKLEDYVKSIPDFPEKGIIFRDITTVLQDPDGFKLAIDELLKLLEGVEYDAVVGAESRGFIFGAPIAYEKGKSFVLPNSEIVARIATNSVRVICSVGIIGASIEQNIRVC